MKKRAFLVSVLTLIVFAGAAAQKTPPEDQERMPSFRVIKVTGKAHYRVGVRPEKRVHLGRIPAEAVLRCEPGASIVIELIGEKVVKTFTGSKWTLLSYRKPKRSNVHYALYAIYEIGGSTRRGTVPNLYFPLSGSVRARHVPIFYSEATLSGETSLTVMLAGRPWEMGKVASDANVLTGRLRDRLVDHQAAVAGPDMYVVLKADGKTCESARFNLLDEKEEKEVAADLAEIDKLYGKTISATKCVVRAGVFNAYELRTEAAYELEIALLLAPGDVDLYLALANVYYSGENVTAAAEVIDRMVLAATLSGVPGDRSVSSRGQFVVSLKRIAQGSFPDECSSCSSILKVK